MIPQGSGANTVNSTSTTRQNGSQAADSQPKQVRLPDAPLAMRQMPFACPAKAPCGIETAKASNQQAASFEKQPALPLRPAPSSGPAWKRVIRPAPGMAKNGDSSLISRLSKLTRANGSPIPSGHVAGVVPPHSSHQPPLHFLHQFPQQSPHLPHPSATCHQAGEAQQNELFSSTADQATALSHSPRSVRQIAAGAACDHADKLDTLAKQGISQRLQADPSASVAEAAKPDQAAAQTNYQREEYDLTCSMEVDGGAEQARSPAPQPSPPSQPNEPQVKPKSTQRSRLQLQRPLGSVFTPSPAATHSTADPYTPAGITNSAREQHPRSSHAPDSTQLSRSLLVSQAPGYSSEDPSGHPPGNPLGYPPRQPSGHSSRDPPSQASGDSPGHSPQHPSRHPLGLRHPPYPDAAADTPSASGGVPNRPAKGSVDGRACIGTSALQVPAYHLTLIVSIFTCWFCVCLYVGLLCHYLPSVG